MLSFSPLGGSVATVVSEHVLLGVRKQRWGAAGKRQMAYAGGRKNWSLNTFIFLSFLHKFIPSLHLSPALLVYEPKTPFIVFVPLDRVCMYIWVCFFLSLVLTRFHT